jgi:hypothetical protein
MSEGLEVPGRVTLVRLKLWTLVSFDENFGWDGRFWRSPLRLVPRVAGEGLLFGIVSTVWFGECEETRRCKW